MALSSPGIGSNLDVNSIVSQLMQVEQQPLVDLTTKESSYKAKLSAVGGLKSSLSTFQNAVQALSNVTKFQTMKVTAADSSIATATGTASANPGSYALEVSKLAQAQKLVSAGQASSSTAIGTGVITFDFGTIDVGAGSFDSTTGKYTGASFTTNGSGTKTVTIDSTNNSLAGIRDAINKAGIGVTASIVNDGSTSPYRLVLTDTNTGKTNSMKISVSGDAALQTLLNHDPSGAPAAQAFSETISAQNAEFKVDGIGVSKSSNTVTDVIPGVTLTLAKTNAGSPTSISVSRDSAGITTAVNQFVAAYNQINQALTSVSAYNASTKQAAVLNGDATVRSIQTQIRGVLSAPVTGDAGAPTTLTTLSQIGVALQKDGTLAVDNAKLQNAVSTNFADIAGLFAATGASSDSLVTYSAGSDKTKAGTYALNVTRLATQGKVTGQAAAGLTIDGTNDTLQVKVNGVATTVSLTRMTYASADALAAEVQSQINGAPELSAEGITVHVAQTAGVLTLSSDLYGSGSNVSITGGNGLANLLGAAPVETSGVDVAGTINGVAASGAGQFLTGGTGDATEGLKIQVTGGSTGDRGTVSYTTGYAYQFDRLIDSFLGSNGAISTKTDGLNATLKSIGDQKDRLNDRLADIEQRYRAQFTALDTALGQMTQTSTFLTQQLANLPKIE